MLIPVCKKNNPTPLNPELQVFPLRVPSLPKHVCTGCIATTLENKLWLDCD